MLEDNITALKADMIAMKNSMMQKIFNIARIIKNIEQKKCRDEVNHLREENNSKNEIIMILFENISSIAFFTNTQVQQREATQTFPPREKSPCRGEGAYPPRSSNQSASTRRAQLSIAAKVVRPTDLLNMSRL